MSEVTDYEALAIALQDDLTACRPFQALRRLRGAVDLLGPWAGYRVRGAIRDLIEETGSPIGRAWFPVAFEVSGGLVRVDVYEAKMASWTRPVQAEGLDDALRCGARLAGVPEVQGLEVTISPASVQARIDGRSLEVAVAMATWSRLTGVPMPAEVAFTGALKDCPGITDRVECRPICSDLGVDFLEISKDISEIDDDEPGEAGGAPRRGVISGQAFSEARALVVPGQLEAKLKAVRRAWGEAGRLVTGPCERPGLRGVATLEGILEVLDLRGADGRSAREHRARIEGAQQRGDWSEVARASALAMAAGEGRLDHDRLFGYAAAQAQALTHMGRHREAREVLEGAERWVDEADRFQVMSATAVLSIALVDGDRPEDAARLLRVRIEESEPHVRGVNEEFGLTQLYGSLARAHSALGEHDEAIEAARRALALTRREEAARNHGDLALWLVRAGRHGEAAESIGRARAALERAEDGATAAFLAIIEARRAVAMGDRMGTRAALAQIPDEVGLAVRLGRADVWAEYGEAPSKTDLAAIDAALDGAKMPGVLSRYRARIELRRRAPDLAAVERWLAQPVGEPSEALKTLERRLPY